jgi:hypothetical protein
MHYGRPGSRNWINTAIFAAFMRFFIVIACLLSLASCKKDDRTLGTEVLPGGDATRGEERELPVTALTVKGDPIISYNGRYKYLGNNMDPVFGDTKIGLYTNVNISAVGFSFRTYTFRYAEFIFALAQPGVTYGSAQESALNYSVYVIDSTLKTGRAYYTSNQQLHGGRLIAAASASVKTGTDPAHTPWISFEVKDTQYVKDLMRDTTAMKDNAKLQAKYKGFYIVAERTDAEGRIYQCDLDNASSGLWIHYTKDDTLRTPEVQRLAFSGAESVKYNTVTYDPSAAHTSLRDQLSGNSSSSASNFFVKGQGLVHSLITIPGLASIADSFHVSVNRAELTLYVDESFISPGFYKTPPALALLPIGVNGNDSLALDQLSTSDNARYDGAYDATEKKYVFSITRQVQAILSGKKADKGFHLVVTSPIREFTPFRDAFVERAVFHGTASAKKPRFVLNYVKLEKK